MLSVHSLLIRQFQIFALIPQSILTAKGLLYQKSYQILIVMNGTICNYSLITTISQSTIKIKMSKIIRRIMVSGPSQQSLESPNFQITLMYQLLDSCQNHSTKVVLKRYYKTFSYLAVKKLKLLMQVFLVKISTYKKQDM